MPPLYPPITESPKLSFICKLFFSTSKSCFSTFTLNVKERSETGLVFFFFTLSHGSCFYNLIPWAQLLKDRLALIQD